MEYITDKSLHDFPAWSGAKETLNTLTYEQIEQLENMLPDMFSDTPTDTEINDFLWFENDTIANLLGFRDWEHLEKCNRGEDDEEDDEEEDEDDDEVYPFDDEDEE